MFTSEESALYKITFPMLVVHLSMFHHGSGALFLLEAEPAVHSYRHSVHGYLWLLKSCDNRCTMLDITCVSFERDFLPGAYCD